MREDDTQILAEYNALRAEIIQRMGIRQQVVGFSVVVLGAVLAFDAPTNTLLAYPILGLFLALGWAHNDFRIGEIGEYIRRQIEPKLPGLRWETHFFNLKKERIPLRYRLRAAIVSAGGIIIGTQILAVVVSLYQQMTPWSYWLIAADILATLVTGGVLHWRKFLYPEQET